MGVYRLLISENKSNIWHLIAGILMMSFGLYIGLNPQISMISLAMYLGLNFFVIGVGYVSISFYFQSGWYLLVGMLDIFIGIIFISNLGITAETFPIIFAIWCLSVGVIQMVDSWKMYDMGINRIWSAMMGIIGVIFAFLILSYPIVGAIAITVLMAGYIVLYGLLEILEYIYLRRNSLELE